MTRTRTWLYLGPAMVLAGVILFTIASPRARAAVEMLYEPNDTRTHVIMECKPNQPCAPRSRPMGQTACTMDITGVAIFAEKGTRLRCERVKK